MRPSLALRYPQWIGASSGPVQIVICEVPELMRSLFASSVITGLLLAAIPAAASMRPHRASSTHAALKHVAVHGHNSARPIVHHAVVAMDPDRATQIQSALIKSGYMDGQPTGTWDSASATAMQKMQSDNGWQTKITPDSRALIKLGLGPQQSQ